MAFRFAVEGLVSSLGQSKASVHAGMIEVLFGDLAYGPQKFNIVGFLGDLMSNPDCCAIGPSVNDPVLSWLPPRGRSRGPVVEV